MHLFLTSTISAKNQHRYTYTHTHNKKNIINIRKQHEIKEKQFFHAHLSLFSIQHNHHTRRIDFHTQSYTKKTHFCIQFDMSFISNPIQTGVVYCVLCVTAIMI